MKQNKNSVWLKATLLGLAMCGALFFLVKTYGQQDNINHADKAESTQTVEELYDVVSVVDGDTIRIRYNGEETPLRLIGVDTPETVDSRTTVECFGKEASEYLKELLTGKKVRIEADSTQSDRDKYNRLLRYVYLDGEDVGLKIISGGYGHEYTYNVPYVKQATYKEAQTEASDNKRGLWADNACVDHNKTESTSTNSDTPSQPVVAPVNNQPAPANSTADCTIKGNINNKGEKIYHVPGQKYYNSTKISPEYGERWFCSEAEAQAAGWRKSKV